MNPAEELPVELDVQAVKALRDANEPFLLLDCREPAEYATAKIEGSMLLPMNDTPARIAELEEHRNGRIVVHCHHGGRSMQVTQYLRQQGFSGAQNMQGGIDQWSLEIDQEVPRY